MNLRQLEAFRAVMLSGSVTQAAAALHISQPAVSKLLADLEYHLGFPLFVRSKGVALTVTPEADVFFHEVEMEDYPLFEHPPYSLALAVALHNVARNCGELDAAIAAKETRPSAGSG